MSSRHPNKAQINDRLRDEHQFYKVQKDPRACVSPCFVSTGTYTGTVWKVRADADAHMQHASLGSGAQIVRCV